ncbi:MAG: peptidase S7 [Clostridia bacterium]|nr:peptidase S7 [Clostridia bacterium]
MKKIKGIAGFLVDGLVESTRLLGQGRNVGCFGFIDEEGYISSHTELVEGGLSGIPLRVLLGKVAAMEGNSIIEGLKQLPDNAVFITTRSGKTGLITDVTGVDFFNLPVVSIGVKNDGVAGVGLIMPKPGHYDLATEAEYLNLETLVTDTMEAEKEVLRKTNELGLAFLDLSDSLPVVDLPEKEPVKHSPVESSWRLPRAKVTALNGELAKELVEESISIGQGREVSVIGQLDDQGVVQPLGKIIAGGMGYVPARLMASSAADIKGKSLREIYGDVLPDNAVIVHTHPGGTGVMHVGDASAGPGTWGRPIIAIGHDQDGEIKGATVIEVEDRLYQLADEDERLNIAFFDAGTPEEEAEIRNRKFGIAQEYTGLCKPIELT